MADTKGKLPQHSSSGSLSSLKHTRPHDAVLRVLSVRVKKGRNLAAKDENGLSDPYVKLSIGRKEVKTKVVYESLNPEWNEELHLGCCTPEDVLEIECWDKDHCGKDFMGRASIALAEYQTTGSTERWIALEARGKKDGTISGDLLLQLNVDTGAILRESWLYKKGAIRRNWKKRWFVLQAARIIYFSSSEYYRQPSHFDDRLEKGRIEFSKDCRLERCAANRTGYEHSFVIHVGSEREFAMRAENQTIADEWCDAFQRLMPLYVEYAAVTAATTSGADSAAAAAAGGGGGTSKCSPLVDGRKKSLVDRPRRHLFGHRHHARTSSQPELKRYFGASLDAVVRRERDGGKIAGNVPLFVARATVAIRAQGCDEVGIFRIAGAKTEVDALKKRINENAGDVCVESERVHSIVGVFKSFFRELPEPLLTYALGEQFLQTIESAKDDNGICEGLQVVLVQLPTVNADVLKALLELLYHIASNYSVNKMDPHNLAIVMGPNLLWTRSNDVQEELRLLKAVTGLVASLVQFYPRLFGEASLLVERQWESPLSHMRSKSSFAEANVEEQTKQIFSYYDIDKSGSLDSEEFWGFFTDLVQTTGASLPPTVDASQMLKVIDTDGNDLISIDEFLGWWKQVQSDYFKTSAAATTTTPRS